MPNTGQRAAAQDWWRTAAIYEVYVRSFADGNGDGIGDLAGVRARLPYLAELGIDAIWFAPWYPSPMADAGYDVADYRAVEPLFGSLAEAEKLIAEAHALGIRIIIDIVPNHGSDQQQWFTAALAAPPGSAGNAARCGRGLSVEHHHPHHVCQSPESEQRRRWRRGPWRIPAAPILSAGQSP